MDDFEPRDLSPTFLDLPSQHSGFRSEIRSEYSEESSRRSYSPPAWRKSGSGWFKHQANLSPARSGFMSKEPSPSYHSADEEGDVTICRTATRIPLPASPTKGRSPSHSPEPDEPNHESESSGGVARATEAMRSVVTKVMDDVEDNHSRASPTESNYIRFTGSLAVQQRTDAIENVIDWTRKMIRHAFKSRYNTFLYLFTAFISSWLCANLFRQPTSGPVPDLIKVAGLAKTFEPVIYYSEAGHQQIGELQETGVAVWDLGESVRTTNMTSAPMIVKQLEDLSDSLRDLSTELTSFFHGLDADVDAILLTMEWAKRELNTITQNPQGTISSVWSNAHSMLTRTGLISDKNPIIRELVGETFQQRTRATLERTFTEFLNVMEESINNELTYSTQLFGLFEAIDKQFLNLHRTVIREHDQQERVEADLLSSLWTRVMNNNALKIRKFEKNKELLQTVRDRTVNNKHVLVAHNQRLRQLKSKLESLRRQLVGPLLRGTNSTTLSVEEQIQGLEGTYAQLKTVRDTQKQKTMALMFGARERRDALHKGTGMRDDLPGIEDSTRR